MTAMEHAVSQIQQELLTIRAQIASRVQMSEAAREIDNFADSPSSERRSESHWREWLWSSEGILWQGRGFPTVGEEDGGILRWSGQGVRDDVGVGC